MKNPLFLAACCLLAGLAGCQSPTVSDVTGKQAEVTAAAHAYAAALVKSPAAVAEFYAPDGELVTGPKTYRGPGEVRAFLQPIWDQYTLAEARMEPDGTEIYGDVAYQWGTFFQRAGIKGQPLQEYRGRFVAKWRRDPDGRWLIRRLMTNP